MVRALPLLALPLLVGCNAALKEQNNELLDQAAAFDIEVRAQQERIHELEREVDTCQLEVKRKAVTVLLDAVDVDPSQPLFAVLETTMGEIRVELLPDEAPRTVASFVGLAEGTRDWTDPESGETLTQTPLYDNVLFHRVISEYMIQTGDPLGTGYGGPGYSFPDEFTDPLSHDGAGVVSMANSGADTNGSQFFITLTEATHLDDKHTIFGRVVSGMDVVEAIGAVPTGSQIKHRPDQDVLLRHVRIIRP